MRASEYARIYELYDGDRFKKSFGTWIRHDENNKTRSATSAAKNGAALKFIRTHKARLPLKTAAQMIGVSGGYLSKIESGKKSISSELRDNILNCYGYKSSSFRNFTTKDKRSKLVPAKYRLANLIDVLLENEIELLLDHILEIVGKRRQKSGPL